MMVAQKQSPKTFTIVENLPKMKYYAVFIESRLALIKNNGENDED